MQFEGLNVSYVDTHTPTYISKVGLKNFFQPTLKQLWQVAFSDDTNDSHWSK